MIQKPLVHIGMAKAASTYLQLEVFPNSEGLFNLGKHSVSEDLRLAGNAITRRTSADWNLSRVKKPFDQAVNEARNRRLRPVLSNEDFSVYKFIDPETMARRLREILGSYDAFLIIRDPISWVRSHYLFRLEHLNPVAVFGFDYWLRYHLQSRRIGSDTVEIWFAALARTYQNNCGGKVHILPYELMRADQSRFAEELSQILGVDPNGLLDRLRQPANALRHKISIPPNKQRFYEIFRWVVLRQTAKVESEIKEFISRVPEYVLTSMERDLLSELGNSDEIDISAWSRLFRSVASRLPDEPGSSNLDLSGDLEERLEQITKSQINILRREFGFDVRDYHINGYRCVP